MHDLLLLAQATAPDAWDVWSTPAALIGTVGAAATLVGWLMRQDRRLSKAEELEAKLFGSGKEAGALATLEQHLVGQLERYQTREWCSGCRREVDEARRDGIGKAHDAIRILEARVVDGEKASLKLHGDLAAALSAMDDLKTMVRQLSKDVIGLSATVRERLPRQSTKDRGEEG